MTPIGDELKKGHEYWKRVDVRWIDRTSSIKPKENQPAKLPGHFQIGLQVIQLVHITTSTMNNEEGWMECI